MLTLAVLSLLAADPAGVVNRLTGKWQNIDRTPVSEGQHVFPGDQLIPAADGSRISIALYNGDILKRPCPPANPCGGSVKIPSLATNAPPAGWLAGLGQYFSGAKPMPPVLLRARSAGAWTARIVSLDQTPASLPALLDTQGRPATNTNWKRGLYVAGKERELLVALPLADKATHERVTQALALAAKWISADPQADTRQLLSAALLAALDARP